MESKAWHKFRNSKYGKQLRNAIYTRDAYRCVYCNVTVTPGINATLDHVNPRNNNGSNEPHNLVTSCLRCNSRKRDLSLFDFVEFAALSYSVVYRVKKQCNKPIVIVP